MNKIIIDGYNVIHRVPALAKFLEISLERARDELIRQLKSYLVSKKVQITVVFDGQHPPRGIDEPQRFRNLTVRFSRRPFKADPLIKNLILKEARKGSLLLVTDDLDIVRFAKDKQVEVSSATDFHERLNKRFEKQNYLDKYDHELSADELAEWLDLFRKKGSKK